MKVGDIVKIKGISELNDDGSCGLIIGNKEYSVDNLADIFDSHRLYMLIVNGFELILQENEYLKLKHNDSIALQEMFPQDFLRNEIERDRL